MRSLYLKQGQIGVDVCDPRPNRGRLTFLVDKGSESDEKYGVLDDVRESAAMMFYADTGNVVRVHDDPDPEDGEDSSLIEASADTPDDECWTVPEVLWRRYRAACVRAHNIAVDIYALNRPLEPTPSGRAAPEAPHA